MIEIQQGKKRILFPEMMSVLAVESRNFICGDFQCAVLQQDMLQSFTALSLVLQYPPICPLWFLVYSVS